ncbi:SPASM domain-containing protein, partial [bacterium]|nr:SPASM domain-containing protein [bacterium]
TTNGTLLNEQNIQALLSSSVVQINFSLQSFVDNFPKANPETYFSNILSFCQKAEKERSDLYINFRFWNLNPGEKQNSTNEFFLNRIEDFFQTPLNRNVDPGFNKSKKIRGKIYAHFDSRFEWPNIRSPFVGTQGTCWGARAQIAIHADKKVVPCCLDKEANILLGDLKEQSIDEILNSTAYLDLKEGFEQNQLRADLCQRCTFRERFQNFSTSMTVG